MKIGDCGWMICDVRRPPCAKQQTLPDLNGKDRKMNDRKMPSEGLGRLRGASIFLSFFFLPDPMAGSHAGAAPGAAWLVNAGTANSEIRRRKPFVLKKFWLPNDEFSTVYRSAPLPNDLAKGGGETCAWNHE